jgi:hypothetical protein
MADTMLQMDKQQRIMSGQDSLVRAQARQQEIDRMADIMAQKMGIRGNVSAQRQMNIGGNLAARAASAQLPIDRQTEQDAAIAEYDRLARYYNQLANEKAKLRQEMDRDVAGMTEAEWKTLAMDEDIRTQSYKSWMDAVTRLNRIRSGMEVATAEEIRKLEETVAQGMYGAASEGLSQMAKPEREPTVYDPDTGEEV